MPFFPCLTSQNPTPVTVAVRPRAVNWDDDGNPHHRTSAARPATLFARTAVVPVTTLAPRRPKAVGLAESRTVPGSPLGGDSLEGRERLRRGGGCRRSGDRGRAL